MGAYHFNNYHSVIIITHSLKFHQLFSFFVISSSLAPFIIFVFINYVLIVYFLIHFNSNSLYMLKWLIIEIDLLYDSN